MYSWMRPSARTPDASCTVANDAFVPAYRVVPVIDLLSGKELPEALYTPHQAINKDNIREVYPETPACA